MGKKAYRAHWEVSVTSSYCVLGLELAAESPVPTLGT